MKQGKYMKRNFSFELFVLRLQHLFKNGMYWHNMTSPKLCATMFTPLLFRENRFKYFRKVSQLETTNANDLISQ